jgi:hypothetical protein
MGIGRPNRGTDERGQASVEWVALALVVAVVFAGALAGAAAAGVSVAPGFARTLRCAVLAGCHGEDAALGDAYGGDVAAMVRAYAPSLVYEPGTLTLPVDFRSCRRHACADAPDLRGADVWRSDRGRQATVFTHVVDRRPHGDLFVQYWLYYPDSTWLHSPWAARHLPLVGGLARSVAGHHEDDWESVQVRVTPAGRVLMRASAHHGYAGAKRPANLNEAPDWLPGPRHDAWTPTTGWSRVSRGSHAGHLVDGPDGERVTRADGLALVPVETLAAEDRATLFAISPPWEKLVYADPTRDDT